MAKIYDLCQITYRMSDGRLFLITEKNVSALRRKLTAEMRRKK